MDLTKYINSSEILKIVTIISHGLIVSGLGHGISPLLFIEMMGVFGPDPVFGPIAYFMLVGQVLIILSIFLKSPLVRIISHLTGLAFLWVAIIYFAWYARGDQYVFVLPLFLIPFIACTILTLAGKTVKRLYTRFLNI